jgi:hypothetical protein
MPISPIPTINHITGSDRLLHPAYQAWFASLQQQVKTLGSTGTTSNRPVHTTNAPLYVGYMYFDATLGYPVWVKSFNPTVWVNASGTPV